MSNTQTPMCPTKKTQIHKFSSHTETQSMPWLSGFRTVIHCLVYFGYSKAASLTKDLVMGPSTVPWIHSSHQKDKTEVILVIYQTQCNIHTARDKICNKYTSPDGWVGLQKCLFWKLLQQIPTLGACKGSWLTSGSSPLEDKDGMI